MRRSLAPSKRAALSAATPTSEQNKVSASGHSQLAQPTVRPSGSLTFKRQRIRLTSGITADQGSHDNDSSDKSFYTVVWRKQSMKKVLFIRPVCSGSVVSFNNVSNLPTTYPATPLQHKVDDLGS